MREKYEIVTTPATAITESARVDLDRQRRCGFPEVVFCEGKTADSVTEIFGALVEAGQEAFGTRASQGQADAVRLRFPMAEHNSVARTIRVNVATERRLNGKVAVVTAGTSVRPVAEEAIETLNWMGCVVERIEDVAVAGPQGLLAELPRLRDDDVVISYWRDGRGVTVGRGRPCDLPSDRCYCQCRLRSIIWRNRSIARYAQQLRGKCDGRQHRRWFRGGICRWTHRVTKGDPTGLIF